jgi:hypothetical protein
MALRGAVPDCRGANDIPDPDREANPHRHRWLRHSDTHERVPEASAFVTAGRRSRNARFHSAGLGGQTEAEGRPFSQHRFDLELRTVSSSDPLCDREPEASSLGLRREEWLEELRQRVASYPRPSIGDSNGHLLWPDLKLEVRSVVLWSCNTNSFQDCLPAGIQGLGGVDEQVE